MWQPDNTCLWQNNCCLFAVVILDAHRAWEVIRWQAPFDGLQCNTLPDRNVPPIHHLQNMSPLKKGLAVRVRGERGFNYICGWKDVLRKVCSLIIYWLFRSTQHNTRKTSGSPIRWCTLLLQTLALKSSSSWRTKLPLTICGLLLKMKRVRDVLAMLALVEAAVFRYLVFQGCEFSTVTRSTAYYIPLLTFQQWADGYPITNHFHLTYCNDLYTTCHRAK